MVVTCFAIEEGQTRTVLVVRTVQTSFNPEPEATVVLACDKQLETAGASGLGFNASFTASADQPDS